ncbi:MAG: transposase family protein, partial [Desulfobulbaceae bacterium]|nr:transposase family protein [Desulfobulbaceae bacterium]
MPEEDDIARELALTSHEYMIRHDIIYRWRKERGKAGEIHFCIVVPPTLVQAAIKSVHDAPSLCHPGLTRTLDVVRRTFFWRRLTQDVGSYVASCPTCNLTKHTQHHENPTFSMQEITPQCFETLYMDVLGPVSTGRGRKKYMLVFTDAYSRFGIVRAMGTKEATEIAKHIFEAVVCTIGCPQVIGSDCAAEFLAQVITHLLVLCSIEHKYSSGYSPFAQGKVERAISTIGGYLRAMVVRHDKKWT